jgi:hypothetical protein
VPLDALGRTLLFVGLGVAGLGLLLIVASRLPLLGRLPGDFAFEIEHVRVYVPLATMVILSVVLSAVLTLVASLFGRR